MSKQFCAVVDIDRTPQQVWRTLTDFASYRRWNPFIVEADGTASVGARLTLRMQPVGARAVTLRHGGGRGSGPGPPYSFSAT